MLVGAGGPSVSPVRAGLTLATVGTLAALVLLGAGAAVAGLAVATGGGDAAT